MRVSLREALLFPTRDPNFGAKWIWGTLLLFVGVLFTGGLLLVPWLGYFVVTARAVADGENDFLPEWGRYTQLTWLGLRYVLVSTGGWFIGGVTAVAPIYLLELTGRPILAWGPDRIFWILLPVAAAVQALLIAMWLEPSLKPRKSALLDLPAVGTVVFGLHILF